MNQSMELIAQCHSRYNFRLFRNNGELQCIKLTISEILLNPGKYFVNVIVFDSSNQRHLAWYRGIKSFAVEGDFVGSANIQLVGIWESKMVSLQDS